MSAHLPDLESLQCFLEAARLLNFRAAARMVALTPAAFGRRISLLEELLGVALFERTTRSITLTQAGLALIPAAQRTVEAALDSVRAARGELGPAPMRLSLGTRHELGLSWIEPLLPKLEAALPFLTVDLYFGSGPDLELRLRGREIDCAISSRRSRDPEIESIKIHREDYVFVGAPGLLARLPFERSEQAKNHILFDISMDRPLFSYLQEGGHGSEEFRFAIVRSMGTIASIRSQVVRGAGVAVLPHYLVQPDLQSGNLIQIMQDRPLEYDWFRLLYRSGDARVGVFEQIALFMRGFELT